LTAVGTGIVFAEPGTDAVAVEPVVAWEFCDFAVQLYRVHTDTAFCFAIRAKHGLVDFLRGKGVDGGLGCWARCVAAGMLFHQLGDYAVESFLGENSVAGGGVCRIEKGAEKGEGVGWDIRILSPGCSWSIAYPAWVAKEQAE
jgi:hypothetical protein